MRLASVDMSVCTCTAHRLQTTAQTVMLSDQHEISNYVHTNFFALC